VQQILEKPPTRKVASGSGSKWYVTAHKATKGVCKVDEKLIVIVNESSGASLYMGISGASDLNVEFKLLIELAKPFGPPAVLATDTPELRSVLVLANSLWGNVTDLSYSAGASGAENISRVFRAFTTLLNSPEYNADLLTSKRNQLIDAWRRQYNASLN
jgi:hypothetical protein